MLALLRRKPKARPPSMPISHVRIIGRDAKPFDQDAQSSAGTGTTSPSRRPASKLRPTAAERRTRPANGSKCGT